MHEEARGAEKEEEEEEEERLTLVDFEMVHCPPHVTPTPDSVALKLGFVVLGAADVTTPNEMLLQSMLAIVTPYLQSAGRCCQEGGGGQPTRPQMKSIVVGGGRGQPTRQQVQAVVGCLAGTGWLAMAGGGLAMAGWLAHVLVVRRGRGSTDATTNEIHCGLGGGPRGHNRNP